MEVIENPNYKPGIKLKTIQYLKDDYILHFNDLKNLEIEYSEEYHKVFANFDPIYLEFGEELIKIDCIIGSFKSYHFNGYYEQKDWKHVKVNIGDDIITYLWIWEDNYFKEKNKREDDKNER